jgi:hypothetical protein
MLNIKEDDTWMWENVTKVASFRFSPSTVLQFQRMVPQTRVVGQETAAGCPCCSGVSATAYTLGQIPHDALCLWAFMVYHTGFEDQHTGGGWS